MWVAKAGKTFLSLHTNKMAFPEWPTEGEAVQREAMARMRTRKEPVKATEVGREEGCCD